MGLESPFRPLQPRKELEFCSKCWTPAKARDQGSAVRDPALAGRGGSGGNIRGRDREARLAFT